MMGDKDTAKSRRKISDKFNLMLLTAYVLFVVAAIPVIYVTTKNQAIDSASKELRLLTDMVTSVRNVVVEDTRPHFIKKNEFYPPVVSSTVMAKLVAEKFKRLQPNYVIRMVSDNPLNRENLPKPFEEEIIDQFRADEKNEGFVKSGVIGKEAYLVSAKPTKVKEDCLICHGRPEDAPSSLTKKYGDDSGYNWEVGSIIGASIVGVPLSNINEIVFHRSLWFIATTTTVFGILFLLINQLVKRTIIVPVLDLAEAVKAVSRGDIDKKFETDRNDELGDLIHSFELMRRSMVALIKRK